MIEFEKRQKMFDRFNKKITKLTEEELLSMRNEEKIASFEAKKRIDYIDNEFSRRKPFYSMHDKIVDESIRSSDTTKCAFYDCNEPSIYYSWIGVENETYGLFACRKHTKTLYEPTHKCLGNTDAAKLTKKK